MPVAAVLLKSCSRHGAIFIAASTRALTMLQPAIGTRPLVVNTKPVAPAIEAIHPDRTKRAVVLGAVKVWPGKGGVRRKVGATANLDSSCPRRLCNTAGRAKKRSSRSNKETNQESKMRRSETA
jgi:hypothetical protein